jgi:hypothetical protein
MTSPVETVASERYMAIARRWFTEGWAGNLAMADGIFSEDLRTNGVQDQFAILKQIGYLPDSVHAA